MCVHEQAPKAWRRVTTPSRRWAQIGHRLGIGHRAAALVIFGSVYAAIGLGILFQSDPPNSFLFHTRFPEVFRVALWAGSGAVAIALCRHPRWQWVGFLALAPAPLERLLSYGFAALVYAGWDAIVMPLLVLAPLPTMLILYVTDYPGPGGLRVPWPYLSGCMVYLLILLLSRLVSSWPDPPEEP